MSEGKRWYAIYTRSRYEKQVHRLLTGNGTEAYLPLVKSWRIWSDRRKQVELPLLPSYLFVHTNPENPHTYFDILNTPGVVRFITFEGKAVAIPDRQIDALKRLNEYGIDMACMDDTPAPGTPVEVVSGPMKGVGGEVIHTGKGQQLILRIDTLDKCITLNISLSMVKTLKQ